MLLARLSFRYRRRLLVALDKRLDKMRKKEHKRFLKIIATLRRLFKGSIDDLGAKFQEAIAEVRQEADKTVESLNTMFKLTRKQIRDTFDKELAESKKEVARSIRELQLQTQKAEDEKIRYFNRIDEINQLALAMKQIINNHREEKERLAQNMLVTLADDDKIENLLKKVIKHKRKVVERDELTEEEILMLEKKGKK